MSAEHRLNLMLALGRLREIYGDAPTYGRF
jgi:hypothetical protein